MSDIYGLLGGKLGHSISPSIHSIIFNELNIDGCYHLFEVKKENLKDAVHGLLALGAKGVNVTIPHKVSVMEYIDEVSKEAKDIGAVNTIYFKDGKTIGYNTDYYGFKMMLIKNKIEIEGKRVCILGTGGAARGVLQYVLDNGAKDIKIVSRDIEKCKRGIKGIDLISYEDVKRLKDWDIIINCTPCGMSVNIGYSPVSMDTVKNFNVAIDLIYNPKQTLFLKYADEAKLKWVNGLYMLVGQAVCAEEIWNSVDISKDIVDKIYKKILCDF